MPSPDSLPTSAKAPFTLEGNFFLSGPNGGVPITGRGMATLFFVPAFSGMTTPPMIERIRYDFADQAPVPEPSTLTMVAGGLLAIVRAARKRREKHSKLGLIIS